MCFSVWRHSPGCAVHWISASDGKARWPSGVTAVHFRAFEQKQMNTCTSPPVLCSPRKKEILQFLLVSNCSPTFRIGRYFFFFFFGFFGPHPWHMEIPRLGVASELQLPAHATATATPDLSCMCNLHCSSRQRQILDPLSEAWDRTACSWMLVRSVSAASQQELPVPSLHTQLSCEMRSSTERWGKGAHLLGFTQAVSGTAND